MPKIGIFVLEIFVAAVGWVFAAFVTLVVLLVLNANPTPLLVSVIATAITFVLYLFIFKQELVALEKRSYEDGYTSGRQGAEGEYKAQLAQFKDTLEAIKQSGLNPKFQSAIAREDWLLFAKLFIKASEEDKSNIIEMLSDGSLSKLSWGVRNSLAGLFAGQMKDGLTFLAAQFYSQSGWEKSVAAELIVSLYPGKDKWVLDLLDLYKGKELVKLCKAFVDTQDDTQRKLISVLRNQLISNRGYTENSSNVLSFYEDGDVSALFNVIFRGNKGRELARLLLESLGSELAKIVLQILDAKESQVDLSPLFDFWVDSEDRNYAEECMCILIGFTQDYINRIPRTDLMQAFLDGDNTANALLRLSLRTSKESACFFSLSRAVLAHRFHLFQVHQENAGG